MRHLARLFVSSVILLPGLSSQTISCSILRVIVFFAHGLAATSGSTASSAGCEACGEEGSGRRRKTAVKPASAKQEVSFVPV